MEVFLVKCPGCVAEMGSLRFSGGEKVPKSSSVGRRMSRKDAGEEENEIFFGWLIIDWSSE